MCQKIRDKERKARAEIREISPPWIQQWSLGWWSASFGGGSVPAGQGPLVVGAQNKGLAPSPFILFGSLSHSFPSHEGA